ncbi:KamA family radical SAM protein [Ascidiimonas aurantiaca]|uniref:KamA family radical SAM protein n=1 Tax=Ascidiimonas aurantiaca TaxID=1685432 RepID=UPI0030ED8D3F
MENETYQKPQCSKDFRELLDSPNFTDWKWQQRNSINNVQKLLNAFPFLSEATINTITKANRTLKLGITPYYASLFQVGEDFEQDPLWQQVIPRVHEEQEFAYNSTTENWEVENDMVNPIAQRKYDNRVIIRLSNVCHSYCQFCYEALRTLEKKSDKEQFSSRHWEDTLHFIDRDKEIQEIILSGGEPLMLSNKMLEKVFTDIRSVRSDIVIRIHTRSLTFNPYRIDEELINLLKKHQIKYIGIHITHPNELSPVFFEKAALLQEAAILFANIPLLKGINDDITLFKRFCMQLYENGILPHYLYHFMPFSPGSSQFQTPISTGINLIKQMKRHISNLAVPEFVLPHHSGKYTVPIIYEKEGYSALFETLEEPLQTVQFVNWQNQKVTYPI